MNLSMMSTGHISFLFVFLEGILSFFSPCVIPLIPVYMSYLAGNAKQVGEDGEITYKRMKVFFHTCMFVLGISFAFFILGMSFSVLGSFFKENRYLFTRIGGIVIILLGLFQLGVFDFKFLQKERKIHLNLADKEVNPLVALIMGFTFSFAWTPCIGPALSSVLILASGAKNPFLGNALVFVYAIGFVIPFLALGLFTTEALAFLKRKQKFLKFAIKIGGVILIIMGIMTFTGKMNGISSYLNSFTNNTGGESDSNDWENPADKVPDPDGNRAGSSDNSEDTAASQESKDKEKKAQPAIDFTLKDQFGKEHKLSDYKGKVVFLNFWATWCPPCQDEMPHIEELYQEYGKNKEDVVILGIANPKSVEYPNNQDISKEEMIQFIDDKGYTFPTVFDETGEIFSDYYISAFPTTFMIDRDGNVYGYVSGALTKDIMKSIIEDTMNQTK